MAQANLDVNGRLVRAGFRIRGRSKSGFVVLCKQGTLGGHFYLAENVDNMAEDIAAALAGSDESCSRGRA